MNKKFIKTHLCAQLCHHVCQVLSCMAKNDWFFFSFPPSLLLLLSYTVFCSGHSYHLWNHVWPWDSLGIHTAIRGGYEMVPKVQGTIHILRKHIFCFLGPLHKHLFIAENKQIKLPFSNLPPYKCLLNIWMVFKGLVNGIIVGGFGLGAFIFNQIQTAYLNPTNKDLDDGQYFSDDKILDRVPSMFLMLGSIYTIVQVRYVLSVFKVNLS